MQTQAAPGSTPHKTHTGDAYTELTSPSSGRFCPPPGRAPPQSSASPTTHVPLRRAITDDMTGGCKVSLLGGAEPGSNATVLQCQVCRHPQLRGQPSSLQRPAHCLADGTACTRTHSEPELLTGHRTFWKSRPCRTHCLSGCSGACLRMSGNGVLCIICRGS